MECYWSPDKGAEIKEEEMREDFLEEGTQSET